MLFTLGTVQYYQQVHNMHVRVFHWLGKVKVKVKWSIAVRRRLTATGTHVPNGITQYYLLPGRGDIPAFTPAEAGTRLSDPGGMQG